MNIKFHKTYNIDQLLEIIMHKDVYKHLYVDGLPDGDELRDMLAGWLRQHNNYLINDGVKVLGALTVVKVGDGAVEIHGGVFKAAYGKVSREIFSAFLNKLKQEGARSAYTVIPCSKQFARKLVTDVGFEIQNEDVGTVFIHNKENNMILYRRSL